MLCCCCYVGCCYYYLASRHVASSFSRNSLLFFIFFFFLFVAGCPSLCHLSVHACHQWQHCSIHFQQLTRAQHGTATCLIDHLATACTGDKQALLFNLWCLLADWTGTKVAQLVLNNSQWKQAHMWEVRCDKSQLNSSLAVMHRDASHPTETTRHICQQPCPPWASPAPKQATAEIAPAGLKLKRVHVAEIAKLKIVSFCTEVHLKLRGEFPILLVWDWAW